MCGCRVNIDNLECMNLISLRSTSFAAKATQGYSFQHSLNPIPQNYAAFKLTPQTHLPHYSPSKKLRSPSIKSQQFEPRDLSATLSETTLSEGDALSAKDWEVTMLGDEMAASQGIKIRRQPPTGPPQHSVGPFEFRLQNEGNTPRNILEEIVWHKDIEVSRMKEKKPLSVLKKQLDNSPPARDFIAALKEANSRTGCPALIAEVKKASPSRGVLREDFDAVHIAKAYEKGGAACLSVLTDDKFFQGSFENLDSIRKSGVQCPLLCKEFVIDAWQIFYARVNGADAILLIAAVLPDLDIKYMIKICKLLGLTALVEVHDEREMDRVLKIEGIELVGINNRDLGTFKVDIANTKKLLEGELGQRIREKGIIVVGESGLFTPSDIAYVQEAGVEAMKKFFRGVIGRRSKSTKSTTIEQSQFSRLPCERPEWQHVETEEPGKIHEYPSQ
ncbi:hypothetical protein OROHE_016223 [Orobanche hederae]